MPFMTKSIRSEASSVKYIQIFARNFRLRYIGAITLLNRLYRCLSLN